MSTSRLVNDAVSATGTPRWRDACAPDLRPDRRNPASWRNQSALTRDCLNARPEHRTAITPKSGRNARRLIGRREGRGVDIRPARLGDLDAIATLYNHDVEHSVATLDEHPISVEARRAWFESFSASGPYRVFVADDGDVRGYVCSTPYRAQASFSETVELSLYRVTGGGSSGGCRGLVAVRRGSRTRRAVVACRGDRRCPRS